MLLKEFTLTSGKYAGEVIEDVDSDDLLKGIQDESGNEIHPPQQAEAVQQAVRLAEAAEKQSAFKQTGEVYPGTNVVIPFTAKAADAFMQVNAGLNLAVQQGVDASTLMSVLVFDNGHKLPVAVEAGVVNGVQCHKFADVAIWFYNKRNSFYQNS